MTSATGILLRLLPGLFVPLLLQAKSLPQTDHCTKLVAEAAIKRLDTAGIIPQKDIDPTRNEIWLLAHEALPRNQFREVYQMRLKSHGGEHLTLILDREALAGNCQQNSLRHIYLISRSF